MNNAVTLLDTLIQLHLPLLKNTVLFRSFYGQYNDNPKYIAEELHRRYPEVNIVFAVRDGAPDTFPDYVRQIPLFSAEYVKYSARAAVVVDNYNGTRTNIAPGNSRLKKAIFRRVARKRHGQLNLSTWHGTPLKHIALDEPEYAADPDARLFCNADILLAGCALTVDAFRTAFRWDRPFTMIGTPRNDIFFGKKNADLKEKLGLPADKKILLFAPTFRNSTELSGLSQIRDLANKELISALEERFGGEFCFVFRAHNLVAEEMRDAGGAREIPIIDGNRHSDMAEYLCCADVLLTDYSSSMFDFALSKKPCFLYTPDLASYRDSERGFYFNIGSTPFPIAETPQELCLEIRSFDEGTYQKALAAFLEKIGNVEQGIAAEKSVDLIAGHMGLSDTEKSDA